MPTLPRPKEALRSAANLPAQILPAGVGRNITSVLNVGVDALPELNLPSSMPTFPFAASQSLLPPSPRTFAAKAEGFLPTGAPQLSSLLPDITLPTSAIPSLSIGTRSQDGGSYRPLEPASANTDRTASVKAGGYRSIS